MEDRKVHKILVTWRGQQLNVEIDSRCNIKEFGNMLQELTNVKPDTLKLLVPTNKSSKLITPFSHDHSSLTLQDTGIIEGKVIRMMGVFEDEIEEVSDNGKRPDLRIIGFEEEEKRLRQRSFANKPQTSLILPKGSYIFCDFRTLTLPGIQLNPPPSEALKRMHKLACDPGIIAIMNKHKWRVGIMTELAPVGYVGISPQCILGFNKNMGEEISLRLRTDDLKGFRKYESIKKTLLHELAHMVHSEHDSHFFALNKQLNDEAMSLDWTRSTGHTLTSHKNISSYDEDEEENLSYEPNNIKISNKVGGVINAFASPRASSISAAYKRLINTSTNHEKFEPDPDETNTHNLHNNLDKVLTVNEPDPDETSNINNKNIEEIVMAEPDPDESVTDITNEDEMLRSDPEIERVEEAGVAICSKIQKTVRMLRSQVTPEEASSVLQTLFKIIKNVIEHPDETKFRRLRKANPHFQRNVANYANAMEVLKMVGFMEDVVADEVGRVETYVVLKRNDPGLLWLAKSSLEVSMS